ncbi:MAG: hypothetical protein LBC02_01670 [Planctomycetaceae bacterium]|jgi:hypothetical protein|nr:hypothetical protein [Planctomycetaceae bacterium]
MSILQNIYGYKDTELSLQSLCGTCLLKLYFPYCRLPIPFLPLFGRVVTENNTRLLNFRINCNSISFGDGIFEGKWKDNNWLISPWGKGWCGASDVKLYNSDNKLVAFTEALPFNSKKTNTGTTFKLFNCYINNKKYQFHYVKSFSKPRRTLMLFHSRSLLMISYPEDSWNKIKIVKTNPENNILFVIFLNYVFSWNILKAPGTTSP